MTKPNSKDRMEKAEEFINTFSKEFLAIISWYDGLLEGMGDKQNEMLAFIGAMVSTLGDDNSLYISPEQRKEWEKYQYQIDVDIDEEGGIRYTLVFKEEVPNVESNSGEDI